MARFVTAFPDAGDWLDPAADIFQRVTSAKNERTAVAAACSAGSFTSPSCSFPIYNRLRRALTIRHSGQLLSAQDARETQRILPEFILRPHAHVDYRYSLPAPCCRRSCDGERAIIARLAVHGKHHPSPSIRT